MAPDDRRKNGRLIPGTTERATVRQRGARLLAIPVLSSVVYFAVRPLTGTDAAALAIAGAVPVVYTIGLILIRRQIDLWAVLISVGFAIGCVASVLAGGNSLPLKLHEAAVTFAAGLVLLGAVLARRPLPVSRLLKVPHGDRRLDASLSVIVGAFLVLHALLHLALALTLSTDAYLTAGRAVDWATLGIGVLSLYSYLRGRRQHLPEPPNPIDRPNQRGDS